MNELKEDPFKGSKQKRPLRTFLFLSTVLTVLIYGSTLLVSSIIDLISSHHFDQQPYYEAPLLVSEYARPFPKGEELPLSQGGKIPLNISHQRQGLFVPEFTELQWIKEPNSFYNDKGTYVVKETKDSHDFEYTIKSIVDKDYHYMLFNSSYFYYENNEYFIDKLSASPDLNMALLKTNTTKGYRHSTLGVYWILDIKTYTITPLFTPDDMISTCVWSPTSDHIAFVLNNNVFIKSLVDSSITQVTYDGDDDIFYGRPDWVYEEEVYEGDTTLWWTPDGDKIGFLKFNDTLVPKFTIPYFVQDGYDDYPKLLELKYPKPGYPNPTVDVFVYELGAVSPVAIDISSKAISEKLVTEITWVSSKYLLVRISNRASDVLEYYLVDSDEDYSTSLIRSATAQNSWFEVAFDTVYIPKNHSLGIQHDGYIDTVVLDGYNHLAYFSPPTNPEGIVLTKGNWEVESETLSYNYQTTDLFFVSTMKSSVERHIYSVNLLQALTHSKVPSIANITDNALDGYYRGSFSSGSRYLLLTYSGPGVPNQKLLDLYNGETIKILESNTELSQALDTYAVPRTTYFQLDLGDGDNENIVNAMETLPLDFNPKMKYPVLFFVYGGPGSQTVKKSFAVGFSSVVASQLNCIVVTVDGRGTGYNHANSYGSKFKFMVRDQLGHYEPKDQIHAAKIWAAKPYVDSSRIAIWGWSYGGFLTLKTLETDVSHVFSYGCSVAPVTKWKFYDSVYTERYMRTPQENPQGYITASISNVDNFHGVKRFLMMHGSGDDNVHFQNSLKLIDDFNLAEVENFDFMVFPDSDHSISYHNGNHVVYDRLMEWLRKAFNEDFEQ